MLAVVVTVQVKLLVPELLKHTCCLIYSLSHCVNNEVFSGRNQSIGCAVAWVTIARGFESEYPFYLVGAILQDLGRSLNLSLPQGGEIM